MSIEGQGHFFTIYFPGFVCFVLYLAKISGERLQHHWSSGLFHALGITPKSRANVCAQLRILEHKPPVARAADRFRAAI